MTRERPSDLDVQRVARRNWSNHCPGVDGIINDHINQHGGNLRSGEFGLPSRSYTWYEGKVGHSVRMLLDMADKPPVKSLGSRLAG
ncbi:MAG: hypothetical protein NUV69_02845 [Candidatus Curtissbacteria bacterium]|nr:hypothetical protein [Candidatus Curtissbacteria bacterium]